MPSITIWLYVFVQWLICFDNNDNKHSILPSLQPTTATAARTWYYNNNNNDNNSKLPFFRLSLSGRVTPQQKNTKLSHLISTNSLVPARHWKIYFIYLHTYIHTYIHNIIHKLAPLALFDWPDSASSGHVEWWELCGCLWQWMSC